MKTGYARHISGIHSHGVIECVLQGYRREADCVNFDVHFIFDIHFIFAYAWYGLIRNNVWNPCHTV